MIKENRISAIRNILAAVSAIAIIIFSYQTSASGVSPLRVKVLVGNSQEASGRIVASLIESAGFRVETVDKAPSSSFTEDTIFFKAGSRSAAKDMARAMGEGVVLKPLTWESVFDVIAVTGRIRDASGAVTGEPPAEAVPDAGPAAQADEDVPAISPGPASPVLADEQSRGLSGGDSEGDNYVIGPQDVLQITVWDNKDLSGKVSVSIEGYINYQLIGMVKAAGLTTGMLARKITDLLADGYIVDPQVSVEVDEYKSKKVYIIGEVVKPGTYYLTRKTTFLEAISMAGGPTKDADREVIVVRPKTGEAAEPVLPENADKGDMLPVDIKGALEGDPSQNIFVQGGDAIYVQKAKTFFIMGEVRSPGEYKLDVGTTVRRAISLGGGATEKASMGRTRVVRIVDGKEVQKRVEMDELVKPNDTVVVPESFF